MSFTLVPHISGPVSRETRKSERRVAETSPTLPALAFVFPYHEMLMRGLLKVGDLNVKTRSSRWNYRGPVLLYTSHGRYHKVPAEAHGLSPGEFQRGVIVGVATIVDSRPLTGSERIQMVQNFNKINFDTAVDIALGTYCGEYVEPLPIGLFLKDVKRFKKPVSFKPKPGAIGIMRVPLKQVAKALRQVGVDSKGL